MSGRLLLVNYHYIRPADYPYPGIHPIEPDAFAAEAEMLAARFHMATPAEAEAFLLGRNDLPGDSILLTFDDGMVDHGRAAREVLDPLGIKGAFFVPSQPNLEGRGIMVHKMHWLRATTDPDDFRDAFLDALDEDARVLETDPEVAAKAEQIYVYDTPAVGRVKYLINFALPYGAVDAVADAMLAARGVGAADFCRDLYMMPEDIRALAAHGHLIGAHGSSHMPVTRLGDNLDTDIAGNIADLAHITGARPMWLSYPYGRGDAIPQDTAAFCHQFNFAIGLTLDNGWNDGAGDPSRVKRINTNEVARFVAA
jgi:peptidoglycan/xylan/chitin deacetylase (PgdA/CDA1 family)